MKLLNLREIQLAGLEILKDVDAFCRKNNIQYAIAYGTLLGAVRHKGFIPWDDDIDIIMSRENYTRFQKEYTSDRFSFFSRETSPDCWITFGRVADLTSTRMAGYYPWHSNKVKSGVYLDIFPLDYVPDTFHDYMKLYRSFNTLLLQSWSLRTSHATPAEGMTLKHKIKIAWKHSVHPNLRKIDPAEFCDDYISTLRLATAVPTQHLGQLGFADTPSSYFHKSLLDSFVELPFEGCSFMAPAAYKEFLSIAYGNDYMQFPPEKERVPGYYRYSRIYSL